MQILLLFLDLKEFSKLTPHLLLPILVGVAVIWLAVNGLRKLLIAKALPARVTRRICVLCRIILSSGLLAWLIFAILQGRS